MGNLAACHLLGTIFASAFYSIYLLAFIASVYFLFNVRGKVVRPNKILLGVAILLFAGITVVRVLFAFNATSVLIRV
jgi:hypothetical protein